MAARGEEPSLITEWRRASKEQSAEQYCALARRFLKHETVVDIAAVREADLLRYTLAIQSDRLRTKTISALSAFFAYLLERGIISEDPARRLARAVRDARDAEALADRLVKAGMSESDARRLSWREVAVVAIQVPNGGRRRSRLPPRETPVVRELVERFLRRAARGGVEGLDALLESRVD